MTRKRKLKIITSIIAIIALVLTALISTEQDVQAQAAPTAVPVKVVQVKPEKAQIWNRYSGRAVAVNIAEIRPQVTGTISEVKFEDGQIVKKGDVLVVIDPRPFEAAVKRAEAELEAAKNQAKFNQKELTRAKALVKTDAISERVYDDRSNQSKVANASVEAAEALLTQAKIDLDYAYVKAPFDGRVGRAEITEGNLVESGVNAPILTTLVSNNGIYIDFEVDEKTYANSIHQSANSRTEEQKIPVKISLDDESDIKYDGTIHAFDNRIDPTTGTIRARAFFDNKNQTLIPGLFVTVEMGRADVNEYILVNERAIGTNQDRKYVYVVNDRSQVEYKQIEVGKNVQNKRIVKSGLSEGDLVIVDGLLSVRPGMPVSPTTVSNTSI